MSSSSARRWTPTGDASFPFAPSRKNQREKRSIAVIRSRHVPNGSQPAASTGQRPVMSRAARARRQSPSIVSREVGTARATPAPAASRAKASRPSRPAAAMASRCAEVSSRGAGGMARGIVRFYRRPIQRDPQVRRLRSTLHMTAASGS